MKYLLVTLIAVIMGCSQTGYTHFARVDVPMTIRVHVVSSPEELPVDALALYPDMLACAYPSGDIWVVGTMTGRGMTINHRILGHELMHLLHWRTYGRIENPDQ